MSEAPVPSGYLRNQVFVAFDTETTGMWAPVNRIVEIGAVKFTLEEGETDSFQALVNPQREIPEDVIEIHGITNEMVREAPAIDAALKRFFAFCGDESILVAHNAPFDISFIGYELNRAKMNFVSNPVLDTVDLYHRYFPGLTSYSLASLAGHFGLADRQEHRALSDARLVSRLVINAAPRFGAIGHRQDLDRLATVHRMDSWQGEAVSLPPEFADLQQAMHRHHRVQIDYNHPVKRAASRVIRPQQIFKLGSVYYINAHCELVGAERTFRLDRILRYTVLAD
jgi:DNA polymerase-3 subunit epsilon